MRPADEERFTALVAWATSCGASLHPALEIYRDEVTGFSMRIKVEWPESTSLKPQDEVLACPLAISLSYLNAHTGQPLFASQSDQPEETASKLPSEFMSVCAPHIVGRFFLMQQYLLGKSSFWHPYIATLPQPDALSSWSSPPFWPEEDAGLLEGTNTGIAAETIRTQLKNEYKQARTLLKEARFANWQDYTRPLYNWAYSIFASRSFRPSLVIPTASASLPPGVAIDDFSVLLPVFDIINHSMQAKVEWLVDTNSVGAPGDGPRNSVCRFHTLDTYQPGDQIFNSYGKKTNSELLLSYGFILPETDELHNDYVHVRTRAGSAGGQQLTGGGGTSTTATPPRDFLVSLRPMNHPSSFLGRARQKVAKDADFDIRPEFAHVEDSLVWDLCLMVVGEGSKAAFMATILGDDANAEQQGREQECLRRLLSASAALPDAASQVVEKIKELLLGKLGMEYDKLLSTAPGATVDEDGNEVVMDVAPQSHNQELALLHRDQARKVLENAISTLAPDWQDEMEQS
ncbi:unnamed protein product [Discula destructiva]